MTRGREKQKIRDEIDEKEIQIDLTHIRGVIILSRIHMEFVFLRLKSKERDSSYVDRLQTCSDSHKRASSTKVFTKQHKRHKKFSFSSRRKLRLNLNKK